MRAKSQRQLAVAAGCACAAAVAVAGLLRYLSSRFTRAAAARHPLVIVAVDLWHVRAPLDAPFHPSWIPGFAQMENKFDLLRLRTANGLEGWSAAPAMGSEREGLGSLLGSYFLGERADDLANVRQRVREMSYLGVRVGWIECACWDIVGKHRGVPVHQLLAQCAPVEPPRAATAASDGTVKLYASCGEMRTGEAAAAVVRARIAEGFDAVKLRVHAATLEEDVEQIETCRRLVGPDVVLGVDCNQGWRVSVISEGAPKWDFERALKFCQAAERLGFAWVEEPLPLDSYSDLARLSAAVKIQITGGELNSYGLPEFGVMAAKKTLAVFQPDAVMVGGIAESWAIIDTITRLGAQYSPHTWTNGIGFAINLQLFAASTYKSTKRLEFPLDEPGWTVAGRDAILRSRWEQRDGRLRVPTAPGLGFEIDEAALAAFGEHFYAGTPLLVAVRTVLERGVKVARELGAIRDARLAARSRELDQMADPMLDALRDLLKENTRLTS